MKTKLTIDSLRKRLVTLASRRVVQQHTTTEKSRAEYRALVRDLAGRTRSKAGSVRLWARRTAYRAAHA